MEEKKDVKGPSPDTNREIKIKEKWGIWKREKMLRDRPLTCLGEKEKSGDLLLSLPTFFVQFLLSENVFCPYRVKTISKQRTFPNHNSLILN